MPAQHASHVPGSYAYTASTQPSPSHAPAILGVYDGASLSGTPPIGTVDSTRSGQAGMSFGFHTEAINGFTSRAGPVQNNPSFARHFQHYDQLSITGSYVPSTFDGNATQPPGHAAQSALSFPQSAATTHHVSHELQPTFLNHSMAPSGSVMPSSSEHLDPIIMRTLTHASTPWAYFMSAAPPAYSRLYPMGEKSDSVKRTRVLVDGVRAADSNHLYTGHAWDMSEFPMSSQQNRALPRPTGELSGMNSPFHPDSHVSSSHNSEAVAPRFLASPTSDRPHSADSQPRSPAEIRGMNGLAHPPMHVLNSSMRPFASPQRRFSSASSPTFAPLTSISDISTSSRSPTVPGHHVPDGIDPYYTPPSSSGLRTSTGTSSAASFAPSSTLSAPGRPDALLTTSSDDGSSNVSHSLGEAEMVASFPQFYERARALCLKFNNDATNLLRATPQDVLAQSFQMGTGSDPMKMLNDAKSICERMMFTDFTLRGRTNASHLDSTMLQELPSTNSSSGYPPAFHSPWSPRPSTSHPTAPSGVNDYFTHDQLPKGLYEPDPIIQRDESLSRPPSSVDVSFNNSTLRSAANVNHGTWRDEESEKLKQLAEHSRASSKVTGQNKIDWDWVVERFGASRTRHQILIKATHLGLKPTSTHPSRIRKRLARAEAQATAAATNTPSSSDSSAPPTTLSTNLTYQDSTASPTATTRHYPPHVLNQTVDGRPKSGESSQSVTGSIYEPDSSA